MGMAAKCSTVVLHFGLALKSDSATFCPMAAARLRAKGQVTIPTGIREAARLEEGDPIEFEITADGILMRPQKTIDATQTWFWTREWQAGEREADEELARGDGNVYKDKESFQTALDAVREE